MMSSLNLIAVAENNKSNADTNGVDQPQPMITLKQTNISQNSSLISWESDTFQVYFNIKITAAFIV